MTTWQIGESGTTVEVRRRGAGRGHLHGDQREPGRGPVRPHHQPARRGRRGLVSVPEPQRQVAVGASVVYPVSVTVPRTTAAGTYALQGVVYSADSDPAESSATSKRVNLTVGPPPAGKGIPRWIWLVVAAVVLLVVGVIAFLVTHGGDEDNDAPPDDTQDEPTTPPLTSTAEPRIGSLADLGGTLTADPGSFSVDPDDTRSGGCAAPVPARSPRRSTVRSATSTTWSPPTSTTAYESRSPPRPEPTRRRCAARPRPWSRAWPSSWPLRSAAPPRSARPSLPPPAPGRRRRPCSPCSGGVATRGSPTATRSRAPGRGLRRAGG